CPDRQERRLLRPLSRADRGDEAVAAHHAPGDREDAVRPGRRRRPQGGAAAAARDEALDGGAHPPLQALHRVLPRARWRDLHGDRGAEGRVRVLSRRRRDQPAVSVQDPRAGLRLPAGPRLPLARPHAGRRGGDHRLARHRLRGDRPVSGHDSGAPVAQPTHFEFTPENLERAKEIIAKAPPGRQASAVLPLLHLAQAQHDNWLPRAAMDYVARMLGMAPIRVYEVATFYTM